MSRMHEFVFRERLAILRDPALKTKKVLEECALAQQYYAERVKQFRDSAARDRSTQKFHPSSLHGCMRALIFDSFGAPKNMPYDKEGEYRGQMIFDNGDFIHLRLQILLHRMGLLKQWEVPLEDDGLNMEGHCDGRLLIDGVAYLLEIKGYNENGFAKTRNKPKDDNVWQVNCYMRMARVDRTIILVENKNRQDVHENVIVKSAKIQAEIEEHVRKAQSFRKARELPDREGDGPRCDVCRWCNYTGICFTASKVDAFKKLMKTKGSTKHENPIASKTVVVPSRKLYVVRRSVIGGGAQKSTVCDKLSAIRKFVGTR